MSSILIIDDEDKYFELCVRFMPEHVFLPPARTYREAREALRQHGRTIDLVLLDVHFDIPDDDLLPYDKEELFAKGDRVDLSMAERNSLRQILGQIADVYRRRK